MGLHDHWAKDIFLFVCLRKPMWDMHRSQTGFGRHMSPVCCDFFLCAKVLQGASDDPYLVPSCVTWGLFFMGLEKVPSGEGSFPKYNEEPGLDRRESMRNARLVNFFVQPAKKWQLLSPGPLGQSHFTYQLSSACGSTVGAWKEQADEGKNTDLSVPRTTSNHTRRQQSFPVALWILWFASCSRLTHL